MKDIKNLVSINELKKQTDAFKVFDIFLSKEQRLQRNKIEEELKNLYEEMSKFIDRFSSMGWCAYDSISTTLIKKANETYDNEGLDKAEKVLVNYYKDDIKDSIYRLHKGNKYLLMRYNMIQNAFKEHFEERYYSSVPLFLIIIDGVVNDFTKDKGFFAEGTDVTAWDCLVGCSDSLQTLKNIFNKSRKKTNTEEIRMPYRNGILHGRDLNYEEYPYIVPIVKFLSLWENKNYGELGKILENMFKDADSDKKKAGEARKLFGDKSLKSYRLVEIEERGCGLSKVVVWVSWKCNEIEKNTTMTFGVAYNPINKDKKDTALPWKNNGKWELIPWDVVGLYS